jgi:hypothetical protein
MYPRFFRAQFAVTVLLACLAAAALADDVPAFFGPSRAPLNADGLPSAAELLRSGARIGRVLVQVDDVFEQGSALAAPYRLVNGLHVATQQQTVLQQLLFQTGDLYDPRLIDESARLLRSQRYINDVEIRPTGYDDNLVDVLVRVHDVWTLSPGISFGRKGGENSTRFEFEDSNFLGLGKQAAIARSSNVDRSAWRFAYVDPNLLGSRWRLSTAYSTLSDGKDTRFSLEQPFYALDTRWSAGIEGIETASIVSRYSLGEIVGQFGMNERRFGIEGGISSGLLDGHVNRMIGGLRYVARSFEELSGEPPVTVPADRVLAYPWIGLESIEDEYVSTRNLDQIGRTEDLYLGRSARVELGFAPSALGSTQDALVFDGALQNGWDLGDGRYWISALSLGARLEEGKIANGRLVLTSRYYDRHSMSRVSFASLTTEITSNLDPEQQLLLGGDNGLRGFPLRYQAGTASALLTLEERFYTTWQPLKLVNVGAALFVDAGRTWGRTDVGDKSMGWLGDVGVGLRLGSARSGLGNVLHIDVAFPLNGPKDLASAQFLVETRAAF